MRGTKTRSGQARAAIYRARLRREVAESLAQPKPKMTEAEAFKGFTDEDAQDGPECIWCGRHFNHGCNSAYCSQSCEDAHECNETGGTFR